MKADKTVLLALTDAHHGFFKRVARYAREHRWHLVTDMIYTAKIPVGWQLRMIIKNRGHFPNDEAVAKLAHLASFGLAEHDRQVEDAARILEIRR